MGQGTFLFTHARRINQICTIFRRQILPIFIVRETPYNLVMKNLVLILAATNFLTQIPAQAGQIVFETMYVAHTVVQGTGSSYTEAENDALEALPKGYIKDPGNSPAVECTVSEDMLRKTNGEKCDTSIAHNLFRVTIPLIPSSLAVRK